MKLKYILPMLFALMAFIGCGGGGGSNDSSSQKTQIKAIDGYIKDANIKDKKGNVAAYLGNGIYEFDNKPVEKMTLTGGKLEDTNINNNFTYKVNVNYKVISPLTHYVSISEAHKANLLKTLGLNEKDLNIDFVEELKNNKNIEKNTNIARTAQIFYALGANQILENLDLNDIASYDDLSDKAIEHSIKENKKQISTFISLVNNTNPLELESALSKVKENIIEVEKPTDEPIEEPTTPSVPSTPTTSTPTTPVVTPSTPTPEPVVDNFKKPEGKEFANKAIEMQEKCNKIEGGKFSSFGGLDMFNNKLYFAINCLFPMKAQEYLERAELIIDPKTMKVEKEILITFPDDLVKRPVGNLCDELTGSHLENCLNQDRRRWFGANRIILNNKGIYTIGDNNGYRIFDATGMLIISLEDQNDKKLIEDVYPMRFTKNNENSFFVSQKQAYDFSAIFPLSLYDTDGNGINKFNLRGVSTVSISEGPMEPFITSILNKDKNEKSIFIGRSSSEKHLYLLELAYNEDKNEHFALKKKHFIGTTVLSQFTNGPKDILLSASTRHTGLAELNKLENVYFTKNINGKLITEGLVTAKTSNKIAYSKEANLILTQNRESDFEGENAFTMSIIPFKGDEKDVSNLSFANIKLYENPRIKGKIKGDLSDNFILVEEENSTNIFTRITNSEIMKISLSKYIDKALDLKDKCYTITYDLTTNKTSEPVQCVFEIGNSKKIIQKAVSEDIERLKSTEKTQKRYPFDRDDYLNSLEDINSTFVPMHVKIVEDRELSNAIRIAKGKLNEGEELPSDFNSTFLEEFRTNTPKDYEHLYTPLSLEDLEIVKKGARLFWQHTIQRNYDNSGQFIDPELGRFFIEGEYNVFLEEIGGKNSKIGYWVERYAKQAKFGKMANFYYTVPTIQTLKDSINYYKKEYSFAFED